MTARPALALGLCASLGTWLVAGLRRLSVVDESMSAALERHDSTAARSQAVMEELAGRLEGIKSTPEQIVDLAAQAGEHATRRVSAPATREQSSGAEASTLREELAALKSELEDAAHNQPSDSPTELTQPPS